MAEFNCYDSNRDVYSVIYDPNGNALTHGEIVDLLNQSQNDEAHSVKTGDYNGWTVVALGGDGILLQSPNGHRRRLSWPVEEGKDG